MTNSLCGGPLVLLTTIWAYLSSVTPEHIRSLRMVFIELCIFAGPPIATTISGNMLDLRSPFVGRELRNYTTIFLIGIICAFISLLISLFLVDEEKERKLFVKYFPHDKTIECKNQIDLNQFPGEASDEILNNLFNLQNVRDMFRTFIRPRKHGIRLQMFLLILSTITIMVAYLGTSVFLYQYIQKVFAWSPASYSNYVTAASVINIITTMILAPIFVKVG